MSGLSRTPGKRVWVNSPPRVRIPPSPPISFLEKNRPSAIAYAAASNNLLFGVIRLECIRYGGGH